jgi:hypothetical protein
MFDRQWTNSGKGVVLAIALASLAGCATTFPGGVSPTNDQQAWSYHGSRVTFLPEEASAAMADATAGAVVKVGQTPWGENTSVTVIHRFFAASGRECMKARVSGTSANQLVNLCHYESGAWGATKALAAKTAEVTP